MNKVRLIELYDGLKIKIYSNGVIESLDSNIIRSNGRPLNRKGKILKAKTDKYGYKVVTLSHNNKRKSYTVHRLVAMAFLPNPYNKETVNHIDGIKTNNDISNLEWATNKENQIHKWKTGLANYCRNSKGQFINRKDVMPNE